MAGSAMAGAPPVGLYSPRMSSRSSLTRLLAALVFLMVVLQAVAWGASSTTGDIRGTVTDVKTGKPAAAVRVTAVSAGGRYTATTDAAGRYALPNVAPDTYTVSFELLGFRTTVIGGVTVVAGATPVLDAQIGTPLQSIGSTRTVRAPSAFTPNEPIDRITINAQQIETVQGKTFNQDESSLLRSLPSVTQDKSGTISIRGGFAFQAAYEYEGIDYTTPNANLQNQLQNIGNFGLINGVGGLQLIPGGGDATHGNTGTGLIAFTAKRGTYPATIAVDFESGLFPYDHQAGVEISWADRSRRWSNYFSFIGSARDFQYGSPGTPANELGTRGTNAATLGTLIDPNLVFYSPSYRTSRDFVDNMVVKLGKRQRSQLQVFYQGQAIKEDLDYGGFVNLGYPTAGSGRGAQQGLCPARPGTSLDGSDGGNTLLQQIACSRLIPLLPGQASASARLTSPDRLFSPYTAFKVEFSSPVGAEAFLNARVYRTISEQQQILPSQGVQTPSFGGTRSGFSAEVTRPFGTRHTVVAGMKYEFSQPYGQRYDATRFGAFTYGLNAAAGAAEFYNPTVTPYRGAEGLGTRGIVEPDFLSASECSQLKGLNQIHKAACGYLARWFPNGASFPLEITAPTAKQQVYAAFVQDAIVIGRSERLRLQPGLRLEGYNFLVPDDPLNPPSIPSFKHQRLFEPHFGASYRLTARDAIKANYGHTLSVPVPFILGNDVQRSAYSAYDAIPSFDNTTGGPATYCGFDKHTLCRSYADQLYWLTRDYRYGAQPLSNPLKGSTFTNLDVSWEHQFGGGISARLTPFYRRGYDIIEQAADPVSVNPLSGALQYGNAFYTNLGTQRATGVELFVSRELPYGISALFGATYINQFGNEPPGAFLTSAALASGTLYHSPDLSPFQTTLALTYRTKSGLKFNPVFSYNAGYPFGAGYNTQTFCGSVAGTPVTVPNTNVTTGIGGIGNVSPNWVDPMNPGTCFAPNIAATRGVAEPRSAGGLYSHPTFNLDTTIEYALSKRLGGTVGVQVTNVLDQLYGTPVYNTCYGSIVSVGTHYGTAPCPLSSLSAAPPTALTSGPYVTYPNRAPRTFRVYYQTRL
jgi:hypothetical protein